MTSDLDLLRQFTRENSQDAFAEIVRRYLNLVYSAALRQVRSPQLAEEISQSVFADLARSGTGILPVNETNSLAPWLYSVTRRTAIDVIRKESRRQLREQIAVEMNDMNAIENSWAQIEPFLDEAMAALGETDRAAILLRYFENKNLREVGEQLKISDDAAQKRVSRAVEKLREFFSKQKIAIGASGLVVLISANAVQSAPIGLAAAVSAAAVLTGTTISTSTVIAATKTIAMTTLQKSIIGAALAAVIGTGIFAAHKNSKLRNQIQTFQQQQTPLTEQIKQLQSALNDATNQLAGLLAENAQLKSDHDKMELLKLRGETGVLQQQANELAEQIQNLKTNQLSTSDKFELAQLHYGNAASAFAIAANRYMETNNGQYPTSFDQLNLSTTNFTSDIELTNFEFVDTTNWRGEKIFFQVRVPIQNPNGNWIEIDGATNHTEIFNVSPQSN